MGGRARSLGLIWYEDDLDDNSDGYDYELADAPLYPMNESDTPGTPTNPSTPGTPDTTAHPGSSVPFGSQAYPYDGPYAVRGTGPNLYGYERGPVYRSTDGASGAPQTATPTTSGTTAGGTSTPYTGSTGAYDAGAGVAAGATTGATGTPAGSGTVQTVVGSGQQAGNAAQAGQAAQGTATTSAPLSRTADTTPTLLPLGIAAAGTALLAYSKRRERIEREREQSDEQ